ncbi:helix-turn-helix domain-containing protein, partial [Streptomyces sp. NPDC024062]
MPDTTGRRPYHHGNLRTDLLDAAERSLRAHGAEQLSLRDLARDVGVSHAAPRRHFADRRALLDALAESGFTR